MIIAEVIFENSQSSQNVLQSVLSKPWFDFIYVLGGNMGGRL